MTERTMSARALGIGLRAIATAMLLLLGACGGTVETPGEPLRLLRETLPEAFIGEPYQATLRAVGGLRPFTYTLSGGELPPGLELSAGAVVGTPTETGRYSFAVTVSDASLNTTFEEFTLAVVEVPPPTIVFNAPLTEVQRRFTLRAVVDGRELRALRTRISWDEDRFAMVDGSLSHGGRLAVITAAEPGLLQVDLAALGEPISGTRQLFSFDLEPLVESPRIQLQTATEFLARDRHFFAEATEGGPPIREPDAEPATADEGEGLPDDPDDPDDEGPDGTEGAPDDERPDNVPDDDVERGSS